MINKLRCRKISDKKTLHKVHKKWVVVSTALLGLVGAGAVSTMPVTHADTTPARANQVSVNTPKPSNVQTKSAVSQGPAANSNKVSDNNMTAAQDTARNTARHTANNGNDAYHFNLHLADQSQNKGARVNKPEAVLHVDTNKPAANSNVQKRILAPIVPSVQNRSQNTVQNNVQSNAQDNAQNSSRYNFQSTESASSNSNQSMSSKAPNTQIQSGTQVKGSQAKSISAPSFNNDKKFNFKAINNGVNKNGLSKIANRGADIKVGTTTNAPGSSNAINNNGSARVLQSNTNTSASSHGDIKVNNHVSVSSAGSIDNTGTGLRADNEAVNAVSPDTDLDSSRYRAHKGAGLFTKNGSLVKGAGNNNNDSDKTSAKDPYEDNAYEPIVTVNYLDADNGLKTLGSSNIKTKASGMYRISNEGAVVFNNGIVNVPYGYHLATMNNNAGNQFNLSRPGLHVVVPRSQNDDGSWNDEHINIGVTKNARKPMMLYSNNGTSSNASKPQVLNMNSVKAGVVNSINNNPNLNSAQKVSLASVASSDFNQVNALSSNPKNSLPSDNVALDANNVASGNLTTTISSDNTGLNSQADSVEQAINKNVDLTVSQKMFDNGSLNGTLTSASNNINHNVDIPSINNVTSSAESDFNNESEAANEQTGRYTRDPLNPSQIAPSGYHFTLFGKLESDAANSLGKSYLINPLNPRQVAPTDYHYDARGQLAPDDLQDAEAQAGWYPFNPLNPAEMAPAGAHYNGISQLIPDEYGDLTDNGQLPDNSKISGFAKEHVNSGEFNAENGLAGRYADLGIALNANAMDPYQYDSTLNQLNYEAFVDGNSDAKNSVYGSPLITNNSAYRDGFYAYTDGYVDGTGNKSINLDNHDYLYREAYAAAYKVGQGYTAKVNSNIQQNNNADYADGYRDSRKTILSSDSLAGHSTHYIVGYVNGMNDRLNHEPDYVIANGAIALHSSPNFNSKNVVANYPGGARNRSTEFVVNGIGADKKGDVRYHVIGIGAADPRSYKQESGWITADKSAVHDTYYRANDASTHGNTIRVISHTALVHSSTTNWGNDTPVKHLHYGDEVNVQGIVKVGNIYRFYIAPNEYVSANKGITQWLR